MIGIDHIGINGENWVHIFVPVMENREQMKIGELKGIYRAIKMVEGRIKQLDGSVKGWVIIVKDIHPVVQDFVKRIGGDPLAKHDGSTYFAKEV